MNMFKYISEKTYHLLSFFSPGSICQQRPQLSLPPLSRRRAIKVNDSWLFSKRYSHKDPFEQHTTKHGHKTQVFDLYIISSNLL